MNGSHFDVVIVGAGAAGMTAAIGLARAGIGVAVVEAAAFPGAENWSGCVYFCENLAEPDILGPEGVEALAWERRLVERGFFTCDGHSILGLKYRSPQAFRHCYTVLRPIFDDHLAQVALSHGVALLNRTTAESLIRENGRVVGICTNRGPLYGDLVFLAEGDASHLVTREGYERFSDQRETPKFLQGIKQVIDLPAGAIEEIFRVGPEEGIAYEMLLRNGTLRGRALQLNMGGFVYANRQSLSIGLVLPADNLRSGFDGDPNLLMEWFAGLPALQPWFQRGRPGVFGAKIIRGGGANEIPYLVDDGLAIGGAASAIGIDFPYPNFTGPATAMGRLLAHAVLAIKREGADFSKDALRRYYLEPLQRTHYWKDVEFLRHWPGYVKKTQVFFGRNIDLTLGTAYVWTRPRRWFLTKWMNWLRLILQVAGPGHWRELREDLKHLMKALRLRTVLSQPQVGRLLLDGTINTLRDLTGTPRANVSAAETIKVYYAVAGDPTPPDQLPVMLRSWFRRLAPVLASAAGRVYHNDDVPLSEKLPHASQVMMRQLNFLDLMVSIGLGLAALISGSALAGWDWLAGKLRTGKNRAEPRGIFPRYARAARQAFDLTPMVGPAAQHWDERLGQLSYETVKASHIHVLWPRQLRDKKSVEKNGLWHVCPAHVYEARANAGGQLQIVVNFENCIKCETCWRTTDLADWGRDGAQRFTYTVDSPVVSRLLQAVNASGAVMPRAARGLDPWLELVTSLQKGLEGEPPDWQREPHLAEIAEIQTLVTRLDGKLLEFDAALAREPRIVDRGRSEYLEMLARYAQQMAVRLVEILRGSPLADSPHSALVAIYGQLLEGAQNTAALCEKRERRTWDQRFAWAAADGRQLRQHHLVGLRRILEVVDADSRGRKSAADPTRIWLRAEDAVSVVAEPLKQWRRGLDSAFSATSWREREQGEPLSAEQDCLLRELIARVPMVDAANLAGTLHPPARKALLAELGRRDPSLAYRVAAHLWARDVAQLHPLSPVLIQAAELWTRGEEWACFAVPDVMQSDGGGWAGEATFVPAAGAKSLLLLLGGRLTLVPVATPGVQVETLQTLGLRGAGLCRVRLDHLVVPENSVTADHDRVERVWQVLSSADLTAIAFGMADILCARAVAHAATRVQFPGLFQDEEARDPIGKFGAVKKMVAEIAARRYLLETLDHSLSPANFSGSSVELAGLVKALAAEALCSGLDSVTYNAGQVFGGTGYSEDDILSKFYRDAAAWRFLGTGNGKVYRLHGEHLLRTWNSDGRRLPSLPNEGVLFDQLVQRNSLQAELDEARVLRARLRGLINAWIDGRKSRNGTPRSDEGYVAGPAVAEVMEGTARQSAMLLAAKAMVLRTHARLEENIESETEIALLRVWLGSAVASLEKLEAGVHELVDSMEREALRPIADPRQPGMPATYSEYLSAQVTYDSGDFLVFGVNPLAPRFVPDMVISDPVLAGRDREIRSLIDGHFGPSRGLGVPYERYIEARHRPDEQDLDFCRQHGFFRMTIPRELGGEGRQKVDYYLLTTNAQRYADVAISLTIQVNASIGTTPIFLARDKDLPKAQSELGIFVGDPALQQEVEIKLLRLIDLTNTGTATRVQRGYGELQQRLEETVLARGTLRALASRFVTEWQKVGRPDSTVDFDGMKKRLEKALAHWHATCSGAEELHAEIGRRHEACALYLRWIASGQISAFALTEPSAGSDTARVATRARLLSAPVEVEADGVLKFVPAGSSNVRYLLDARRLEFRADGVYYAYADSRSAGRIHFDAYDYETDDRHSRRYYLHGNRRVDFTDIAQLREREGRWWYDYWELNGSKMWITNGRMCGVMCLYAKTDEGVTGFLVDRHAEGLIVGKDEAKMGQLGSPTNEIALQSVRVPRENVLGLEGRGQVNALETLNVGRAGLSMSGMAQMTGLIEFSRAFANAAYGEIPDWVAWRLARMEEERFSAEALAHEVVGRFEHAGTKSVRMESAIAKMQIGEILHRIIEMAEDIHGLPGQTQAHLIEKRKRDARILNIYEGTNEIQRFFILKDLASELAPRWSQSPPAKLSGYQGAETLELETVRHELHKRVTAALDFFQAELWQNPNLQANCFLLAEAVAWFKTAESTLARLAWLERQAIGDENADPSPLLATGRRALARCISEVRLALQHMDEELTHLRRGFYAPEVRAATLLFDRAGIDNAAARACSNVKHALRVLVVVEASVADTPHPQVSDGRLLEPHFTINLADRAALENALRIRDDATAPVAIVVASVGPPGHAAALREALSLGADSVCLISTDGEAVATDAAAKALASVLADRGPFDLVLSGVGEAGTEEGLLGMLTAVALGVPCTGRAASVVVQRTDAENNIAIAPNAGAAVARSMPAFVEVEAGLGLRQFTIQGYLAGLKLGVEILPWPATMAKRAVTCELALQVSTANSEAETPGALAPAEAAEQVLEQAGIESNQRQTTHQHEHVITTSADANLSGHEVVAVLGDDGEGHLHAQAETVLRAARQIAGWMATEPVVLLLTSSSDECQQRALSALPEWLACRVLLLATERTGPPELKARVLQKYWPELRTTARYIVGEPWSEQALAHLAIDDGPLAATAFRVRRMCKSGEQVVLETVRGGGKLRLMQTLPFAAPSCWLSMAAGAEIDLPASAPSGTLSVECWAPDLQRFYEQNCIQQLLADLRSEAGIVRLADAEFIIDVGFGIGNRDGYEQVIEPLEGALRNLGVRHLAVGGSRKVTEELHLLPVDRQIGQSGVGVNPRILLAIGVSGAPQHLNYLGQRASIIAFNRDPEAPLLTLNQRQPRPRVYPVLGDLFETVPAFIAALNHSSV